MIVFSSLQTETSFTVAGKRSALLFFVISTLKVHQVLLSTLFSVVFGGEGLRFLWGGIAGRTCMFRSGSVLSGAGKEHKDWLWWMPGLWLLDIIGGGRPARLRPRELRGRDLDFLTPWETWSGGKETEQETNQLLNLKQ